LYFSVAIAVFGFGGFLLNKNRILLDSIFPTKDIYVRIQGKVSKPGVYKMKDGDRIEDLIQKAGGFEENIAIPEYDSNILLEDGEVIHMGDR
jgi:competence protein ComEA